MPSWRERLDNRVHMLLMCPTAEASNTTILAILTPTGFGQSHTLFQPSIAVTGQIPPNNPI